MISSATMPPPTICIVRSGVMPRQRHALLRLDGRKPGNPVLQLLARHDPRVLAPGLAQHRARQTRQ